MSLFFSPSHTAPHEKTHLLPERLDTNVIPFPTIETPAPLPHSSPLSYQDPSQLILPLPITDSAATRSCCRKNLAWGSFQAIVSGSASFLGWDMISGCVLYSPNPLYNIERICSSSNLVGIIFSVIVASLSSAVLLNLPTHQHSHRVFCTVLFLGPTASFLLGILGAFVALGDMGPQGVAVLHVLSALCACFGVFTAVVSNIFD